MILLDLIGKMVERDEKQFGVPYFGHSAVVKLRKKICMSKLYEWYRDVAPVVEYSRIKRSLMKIEPSEITWFNTIASSRRGVFFVNKLDLLFKKNPASPMVVGVPYFFMDGKRYVFPIRMVFDPMIYRAVRDYGVSLTAFFVKLNSTIYPGKIWLDIHFMPTPRRIFVEINTNNQTLDALIIGEKTFSKKTLEKACYFTYTFGFKDKKLYMNICNLRRHYNIPNMIEMIRTAEKHYRKGVYNMIACGEQGIKGIKNTIELKIEE